MKLDELELSTVLAVIAIILAVCAVGIAVGAVIQ